MILGNWLSLMLLVDLSKWHMPVFLGHGTPCSFSDPLQLELENEYNLNVVKEISVTESFLTLGMSLKRN